MTSLLNNRKDPGSFRDPSGFLFCQGDSIFRQINHVYKENYDHLMRSGLYETLTNADLMIEHTEENIKIAQTETEKAYKIIKPERLSMISYPYEWCFSQLKKAALTTLEIQKQSLKFGMSLKDCSAYNIQLINGKPVLIDTLSFEKYIEGRPWPAYRQFCQHFLSPLALMSYTDIRLNQLLRVFIDGVPLDLAAKLLPFRSCFLFTLLSHIHLHAKYQDRFADRTVQTNRRKMSRAGFLGIIDSLEAGVRKLKWRHRGSEWDDYYEEINYSEEALNEKQQLVSEFLERIRPESVWDLGANIGLFSRIASNKGIQTMSFDNDPTCVEMNYRRVVDDKETHILPLFIDLTNPSPGIGWRHHERKSLMERGPADTVFALALIHHLTISNNVPFKEIGIFFSNICRFLIIEFVPKSDSQVQRLLASREDIFPDYTQQAFEATMKKYFFVKDVRKIEGTQRILYLMSKDDSIG